MAAVNVLRYRVASWTDQLSIIGWQEVSWKRPMSWPDFCTIFSLVSQEIRKTPVLHAISCFTPLGMYATAEPSALGKRVR